MSQSVILPHGSGGFLDVPAEPSGEGLVLTHGAGANCQSPLLIAVAGAFAAAGFTVLRYDLPFRQKRSSGPPHPSQAAEDRKGLRAAVDELRRKVSGRIVMGGHSYGGRQASILASEDPSACGLLMLLSYPLHPPNKLDKPRTAHFPQLRTPALFVHGTKDPFGTMQEMQAALQLIPAAVKLIVVEGAGHDLLRGKFDIAALLPAGIAPLRD